MVQDQRRFRPSGFEFKPDDRVKIPGFQLAGRHSLDNSDVGHQLDVPSQNHASKHGKRASPALEPIFAPMPVKAA